MGKLSRVKGAVFERFVATTYRETFPEFAEFVKRASQSHSAFESDVHGLPGFWNECQDARNPTPLLKLEQAERDLTRAKQASNADQDRIAIAIIHKTGTPYNKTTVTMRFRSLVFLDTGRRTETGSSNIPITISWPDFLEMCGRIQPWLL